jgi:hypothetical protein
MTQAVCFNCGAIKWGAFNDCDHCNAHPSTDDELMISLALTDHYFDLAALKQTGQAIKAGRRPTLPEDIKNKLRPRIIEFKRMVGGAINSERDTARKQKKAPSLLETFSQKFAGLFPRTKASSIIPLTDFCIHLSNTALAGHLLPYLRRVVVKAHPTEKRAVVLSILTLALAGHFVKDLRFNKEAMYRDVRGFFQDTNFDTITAEAIVWALWLFRMNWTGDPDRFANASLDQIDDHTFVVAARYINLLINREAGIDFEERAIESDKFYSQLIKAEPSRPLCLAEGFTSKLMQIAGNRTLGESYELANSPVTLSEASAPLNIVVMLFFTTMPSGSYETFKNIMKHWSDLGFDDA